MKHLQQHIIYLFAAIMILGSVITAYANNNIQISQNLIYGTDFVTLSTKLSGVESDTITSNKITKVWYTSSELNVEVYQVFKQQEITITVYNMLGKEVLDVFKGTSSSRLEEVYTATFNLPNGIYICVLQGKNFRDSEKFIISR